MATIVVGRGLESSPSRNRRSSIRRSDSASSLLPFLDPAGSHAQLSHGAMDNLLKPTEKNTKLANRQMPRFVLRTKVSPSVQDRLDPNVKTSNVEGSDETYDRPKSQHIPGSYRSEVASDSWNEINALDALWRNAGDDTAAALSSLGTDMSNDIGGKSPIPQVKIIPESPVKFSASGPLSSVEFMPKPLESVKTMRSKPAPYAKVDLARQIILPKSQSSSSANSTPSSLPLSQDDRSEDTAPQPLRLPISFASWAKISTRATNNTTRNQIDSRILESVHERGDLDHNVDGKEDVRSPKDEQITTSAQAKSLTQPSSSTRTLEGNHDVPLGDNFFPARIELPTESRTSIIRQVTGLSDDPSAAQQLHKDPAVGQETPAVLETISLNTPDEQSRDRDQGLYHSATWHSPASWKPIGETSGYAKISAPNSSRRAAQGSSTELTSETISKVGALESRRSDLLVNKAKGQLRSVSVSSTTSCSTVKTGSEQGPGITRSRTIYWLKDLISGGQSPSPRLTARPSRSHSGFNEISTPQRASTTPNKYIQQGSSTTSKSKTGNSRTGLDSRDPHISETFTKTIDDLELLLGEALVIARNAADKESADHVPALLEDAAALLAHGRCNFNNKPKGDDAGANLPSTLPGSYVKTGYRRNAEETGNQSSDRLDSDRLINHSFGLPAPNANVVARENSQIAEPPMRGSSLNIPQDVTNIIRPRNGTPSIAAKGGSDIQVFVPPTTEQGSTDIRADHISNVQVEGVSHFETFIGQVEPETELLLSPRRQHFPKKPLSRKAPYTEDDPHVILAKHIEKVVPNQREVREYIRLFHQPPIHNRMSSLGLRKQDTLSTPSARLQNGQTTAIDVGQWVPTDDFDAVRSLQNLDGPPGTGSSGTEVDFPTSQDPASRPNAGIQGAQVASRSEEFEMKNLPGDESLPRRHLSGRRLYRPRDMASLRGMSHVSIDGVKGFSLSRSHRRKPLARDWSPFRKRYVASIACISTAMIGIVVGIYAGEVPSIQYYIADLHHYAILGNVFLYIGLSIPVFFFWPLPLLHGRKPYILGAMAVAMPLLFPQAIVVGTERSPYHSRFRVGLILSRTLMGFALGFAQMNFLSILTDLYGASLQSVNPHQEIVNEYDVRRHGGGLGIWLGIWTWCYMGAIGLGFLIGAWIIEHQSPDWGLYVSVIIIAIVLVLNVITPEVRRSAYRRSVTEVRTPNDVSRRLARGEVMMHRLQTGPKWWGEEFYQGLLLSMDMLRQPGLLIMVLYVGWIYGQIILVIVLLGSLMSKLYHFKSPVVGVTTLAIPIGALLAIPFQKASIFSRARHHAQRTDSMTFEKRVTWSSHLIRRAIFTLILPFAGLAYTLASGGPPTPYILPILFAGLIAFLSNLAIAECNGIIMETFDTSDLQPGMTGKPRGASGERTKHKRTNYSSFPRVSSAFALLQGFGFLIAAGATGVGGVVQRNLGQRASTGVMAGILLFLTLMLLAVLVRWKVVQIIPTIRTGDMEMWERKRRESVKKLEEERKLGRGDSWNTTRGLEKEDDQFRPVIIGNPSGRTRRMSIFELGHLTRWTEIRRKNRLIDQQGYEAKHPNLAALHSVRGRLQETKLGSFRRKKRPGVGSDSSNVSEIEMVNNDLGQRAKTREGV